MYAFDEQQGGASVAKIVEPDIRQSSLPEQGLERAGDKVLAHHRRAGLRRENHSMIHEQPRELCALFELRFAMTLQGGERYTRKPYGATTLGRLGRPKPEAPARRRGQSPPDLKSPGVEVHVVPLQAQQLALTHPRRDCQHIQRLELLVRFPDRGKRGHQDTDGRLWDLLYTGRFAASRADALDRSEILYRLYMDLGRKRLYFAKFDIGPGDAGEPVVTIMRPEEDRPCRAQRGRGVVARPRVPDQEEDWKMEEIIGRLPSLTGPQIARPEDALHRERQRRSSATSEDQDSARLQNDAAPLVTEILEYRLHEDGYLQLELRCYIRRDGSTRERGPYWYFQYHEGGKRRKLYLGKTDDPASALAVKRATLSGD